MAEKQLNVRIGDEAFEKLESTLERCPDATKNSIIEDLLVLYLPAFEELQLELKRYKFEFVKQQHQRDVTKRRTG